PDDCFGCWYGSEAGIGISDMFSPSVMHSLFLISISCVVSWIQSMFYIDRFGSPTYQKIKEKKKE
ncbi:MAG: hypothetical protein ACFFCT_14850, partial [Candidatus Odinarchaeota archaeon]